MPPRSRTFAFLSGLALAASMAEAAPEPRVFATVEVIGAERFEEEDVLATSGLRPDVALGEAELRGAVEALEATSEFEDVRIRSRGDALIVEVDEQPAYEGRLSFGAGYDTDIGALASAGLALRDPFGPGTALEADALVAERLSRASATALAGVPSRPGLAWGLRAKITRRDLEGADFQLDEAALSPFARLALGPRRSLELRYVLASDDIRDVAPEASPILRAEAGSQLSSGVGATLRAASPDGPGPRWAVSLSLDVTGLAGDTNLATARLRASGSTPLGGTGLALRSTLEAGAVAGLGGDDPRASDRFALGGTALRGFEPATIGPRDVARGRSTLLGGDRFAVSRNDLVLPSPRVLPALRPFLFADVGTAWGLDVAIEPAGRVSDGPDWRGSAGVGAGLSPGRGRLEAYHALLTRGGMGDEERRFGLAYRVSF